MTGKGAGRGVGGEEVGEGLRETQGGVGHPASLPPNTHHSPVSCLWGGTRCLWAQLNMEPTRPGPGFVRPSQPPGVPQQQVEGS